MERNNRKVLVGVVVSDKMDKTIVVRVDRYVSHPVYLKKVKKAKKYKVHDENNTCDIGDKVRIMETRPLSREKHWRLVEIVEKVR